MDDFILSNDKKRQAEDNIFNLSKRIKDQEEKLCQDKKELIKSQSDLKKKMDFKYFFETICSNQCMICNEPFLDCIGSRNMGITSYVCRCSKPKMVHIGCFTSNFNCVCGIQCFIRTVSSKGKSVKVTVEEENEQDRNEEYSEISDLDTEFEFSIHR